MKGNLVPALLSVFGLSLTGLSLAAFGADTISGISVVEDRPTLTSLGFQVLYSGDDNRNGSVTWRYRQQGQIPWRTAYPMLRVLPETVAGDVVPAQFAGSIVDLRPATTYEIEIQVQDPDSPAQPVIPRTSTTRGVPGEPASPHAVVVNDIVSLQNAVSAAAPGDVITVQPGTYAVQSLSFFAGGASANPVILRGASASGVIFDGGNCDCNIIEIYGSYTRIESLTLQNATQAIRFQGAGSTGNGVRYATIRDVASGINGKQNQQDFYIADNVIQGRLNFPANLGDGPNALQDTYGVAIFGFGHVIAHNRISSFADAITISQTGSRALDIYGNDIPYTFDDGIQLDGSDGNIRVFRNRFTNVFDGISFQPLNGGPAYVFRNMLFNVKNEPYKLHAHGGVPPQEPSGVLLFHNTTVNPGLATNLQTTAATHNSLLLNNLFIGQASLAGQQVGDFGGFLDQTFLDYDGYFPDGRFFFRNPQFAGHAASFASIYPAFGLEQHGRVVTASTFAGVQTGPASWGVLQPPQDLSLSATSLALDAGALLANFNDDFTGPGPDLGALERNCPLPVYGPRAPGVDESNSTPTCPPAGAPPTPPNVISVSPSGRSAAQRVFTITAGDANGWFDIVKMSLAFGAGTSLVNSCVVEMERGTRQMFLWNDAGTVRLGPLVAGSAGSLENSYCLLSGPASSVTELTGANQVVWNADMTFKTGYRQLKTIFGKADDSISTSGWLTMGTWR